MDCVLRPRFTAPIFGAVLVLWFFTDFWIWIIDPELISRPAGKETADYWHWWYTALYLRSAAPWILLGAITPVKYRFAKGGFIFLAAVHLFAAADLQITGNQAGSLWEPAGIIAAFIYTLIIWELRWKVTPESDPIEPGKAYLITRPPRSLLELIGSWLRFRWGGSALIYSQGVLYGFNRDRRIYGASQVGPLVLKPGQVAKAIDTDPEIISQRASCKIGQKWRGNCFEVAKSIIS
jgi:hypothetical protein